MVPQYQVAVHIFRFLYSIKYLLKTKLAREEWGLEHASGWQEKPKHKMKDTNFGIKNVFKVYFEYLVWPISHLLIWTVEFMTYTGATTTVSSVLSLRHLYMWYYSFRWKLCTSCMDLSVTVPVCSSHCLPPCKAYSLHLWSWLWNPPADRWCRNHTAWYYSVGPWECWKVWCLMKWEDSLYRVTRAQSSI